MKKINVLIVDDAAIIRKVLSEELSGINDIKVVGTAPDPYIAREKILKLKPDVVTLDIEMPRMDGISFLEKLMKHHPIPIIILSSISKEGSNVAIKALNLGAVDVMQKPNNSYKLSQMISELVLKIRIASKAKIARVQYKQSGLRKMPPISLIKQQTLIVALGASTGGTIALREVLTKLPKEFPGIVITQHMPEFFTKNFARDLDRLCKIEVREARNGDKLEPGLALIAPGNYHMLVRSSRDGFYVEVKQGPTVCYQRPSVEVLFESVAKYVGNKSLGVIFTGMGDDGAKGLLKMRNAGACTIAQDEESCVVYGMPREAAKIGAAEKILPLDLIPMELMKLLST